LLEKIEQVVRLIRSKGVGVYFVTQNPLDIPDSVLGQLGNRVQHALRAFTPRDQKAVKTAADTLRANPAFDAVPECVADLHVLSRYAQAHLKTDLFCPDFKLFWSLYPWLRRTRFAAVSTPILGPNRPVDHSPLPGHLRTIEQDRPVSCGRASSHFVNGCQ
jgi:hypothetical protein